MSFMLRVKIDLIKFLSEAIVLICFFFLFSKDMLFNCIKEAQFIKDIWVVLFCLNFSRFFYFFLPFQVLSMFLYYIDKFCIL